MKDFILSIFTVHIYHALKAVASFVLSIILKVGGAEAVAGIYAVALLMGLDIITGIMKAAKLESFNTSDLRRLTFAKLLTYLFAILSSYFVAGLLPAAMAWLPIAILIWIAITEFGSIAENLAVVTGIHIPTISKLKELFDQYRGVVSKGTGSDTSAVKTVTTTVTTEIEEDKQSD